MYSPNSPSPYFGKDKEGKIIMVLKKEKEGDDAHYMRGDSLHTFDFEQRI